MPIRRISKRSNVCKRSWPRCVTSAAVPIFGALRDEALRAGQHRRRRVWFASAAAAAAALILASLFGPVPARTGCASRSQSMVTRLSGAQIYSTSTGQRSTFVLDDGSSIELNAQSRIEVRFSDYRRDVALVEGQALFNVAKDLRRPFIVRAGNRQVLALGTRFDVRLDSTSVQVTLLEGKVRVEENTAMWKRGQEIELTPGKQLVARMNTSSQPTSTRKGGVRADVIRDIDVAKVTGWREGRIYFDDLPLEEAVREMNRHSTVHIRLDSAELAGLRVNGMFKAGDQEIFVSALQEYFQIEAQRQGAREIVLTKVTGTGFRSSKRPRFESPHLPRRRRQHGRPSGVRIFSVSSADIGWPGFIVGALDPLGRRRRHGRRSLGRRSLGRRGLVDDRACHSYRYAH